jgi:hypothetical protein
MNHRYAIALAVMIGAIFIIGGQLGAAYEAPVWINEQSLPYSSYWGGEAYNWLNGGIYLPYGYDSLSMPMGQGAAYRNNQGPIDGSYWGGEAYNWLNSNAYVPYGYDLLSIPRGQGAIYRMLH